MQNTSGLWKWVGATVLVVVLGLGIGFYVSSPKQTPVATADTGDSLPGGDAAAPPATTGPAAAMAQPPVGQYLAKGAPDIQILEQAPDPNAKSPAAKSKTTVKPTTTATATTPATPNQTALPTETPQPSAPVSTPSDTNSPQSAPSQPPAPDQPQPAAPVSVASDSSAVSLPTAAPSASQTVAQQGAPDGPIYHVLVGTTFANEKNARIFAADLRHRGFMAMTASVSSDSGIVYKVQVGAYRNRLSAEEAANQLQQSGYPAYIATDR